MCYYKNNSTELSLEDAKKDTQWDRKVKQESPKPFIRLKLFKFCDFTKNCTKQSLEDAIQQIQLDRKVEISMNFHSPF